MNDFREMPIEEKKKVFRELMGEAYTDRLMEYLEEKEYFYMPASMKHHGAVEGGLFEHSVQVALDLSWLTNRLGLKWERKNSPAIVGLLHDICKLEMYDILPFGDEPGEIGIEKNTSSIYPGHGDKSLILLMGIYELTEEEKACIRYHMGAYTKPEEWEYLTRAMRKYPNVLYTHTADMIASQLKDR